MSYLLLILAVILGVSLVFLLKPSKKFVQILLAFSGAYLLSVTILHLVPEVYVAGNDFKSIGIYILIGIILQSVLESFSKGAEHGHVHLHTSDKRFPSLLFVSLCIHAFSEGLPIHNAGENLLWAIVVHKIPIAIVFMSPLGMLLGDKILFFKTYASELTALIIGVFLHISTIILFESSENHKFNLQKFTAILIGILLTIFTL